MASLSDLKQDKKDTEKELKKYEKRLKEVKAIRKDLDDACDDYVSDINGKVRSAVNQFGGGVNSGSAGVDGVLSPLLQKGVYEDADLSSCRSDLSREISRIEDKIGELKREIRTLDSSIADAKSE